MNIVEMVLPSHPAVVVATTLSSAMGTSRLAARSVMETFRQRDAIGGNPAMGQRFGRRVANDIHGSYCRDIFNDTEEDLL